MRLVFEAVLEDVAHGDELDVGAGLQALGRGAGAAAAAADHADADGLVAGGVGAGGDTQSGRSGGGRRGKLEEVPPGCGGVCGILCVCS